MRVVPRTTLVAAACLAALPSACGRPSGDPPAPRLVVLYAPCTVARDRLAPWNAGVAWTPHLSAFAEEGLVFERHHTEAGQSGVAYAALFSGTHADRHEVFDHPSRLRPEAHLIAESFAAAGWETHFWSGQEMGSARLGYGQGVADENTHVRRIREHDRRFLEVLERVARDPDARAYVQIHFTVSHAPYHRNFDEAFLDEVLEQHPELGPGVERATWRRWTELFEREKLPLQRDFAATVERLGLDGSEVGELARVQELAYRVALVRLDRLFGSLLEDVREAGLADASLIAFTTDHGEVLLHEDRLFPWSHGLQLAPEVLEVPLILRGPDAGVRPGRYAGVTRSIDLHATLAGLCGVPVPAGATDGVDLSPSVRGVAVPPALPAFSHTAVLSPDQLERSRGLGLLIEHFPRSDVALVWTRLREGDRVLEQRRSPEDGWSWIARDAGAAARPVDPAGVDPELNASIEGLRDYRARLREGWERRAARREDPLPMAERIELLKSLGYVK